MTKRASSTPGSVLCALLALLVMLAPWSVPFGPVGDRAPGAVAQGPPAAGIQYLPLVGRYGDLRPQAFGVQSHSALDETRLDWSAEAGAQWIRIHVSWAAVEPSNTDPQHYDWSRLDPVVSAAHQKGIDLILVIAGQPSWAAEYAMGPVYDTADLLEFVAALVERYDGDGVEDAEGSPRAEYVELYNEPDNADLGHAAHGGWGYWGHNGAGYAELLRALYPVVHAASPRAKLVCGGLALDWFEEDGGPFDARFLEDVLAACQGHDCYDLMNFHYYPVFRPNWEAYGPDIVGKANYVRHRLAAYGFADVPLICTETSWHSNADWGGYEKQSRYTVQGYVRGLAAGLEVVIWYMLHDLDEPSEPGLLDVYLEPKPAYEAYRNMTEMLRGAYYGRALTPSETGSSHLVGYILNRYGRRLDVVWTEDGALLPEEEDLAPSLPLTVQASRLRVVDKYGAETWLADGDDGALDGHIHLWVDGSPLFLEYHP